MSERANGRESDPALTSRFMAVLNHSEPVRVFICFRLKNGFSIMFFLIFFMSSTWDLSTQLNERKETGALS